MQKASSTAKDPMVYPSRTLIHQDSKSGAVGSDLPAKTLGAKNKRTGVSLSHLSNALENMESLENTADRSL